MKGRLNNKIAIITGGSSGIGEATARLFASEGAEVVVVARREVLLREVTNSIIASGGRAWAIQGDVTSMDDCRRVFEETIKNFGRVDILVNNAGEGDYTRPITKVTDEFWESIIGVNQTSVFYFCREALKYMGPAKSGAIINVSSVGGVFSNSGFAYAASKHAVIGMTRNIAIQFAGTGVRCNAVCPGGTATPMIEKMTADSDAEFSKITGKHFRKDLGLCEASDQANAILFFADDAAKAITGQYLVVDNGGWL